MAVTMNMAEAKAHLSQLVAQAEQGDEVFIARDGEPAVRLTPVKKRGPVVLGLFPMELSEEAIAESMAPLPDDYLDEIENNPIFPGGEDEVSA